MADAGSPGLLLPSSFLLYHNLYCVLLGSQVLLLESIESPVGSIDSRWKQRSLLPTTGCIPGMLSPKDYCGSATNSRHNLSEPKALSVYDINAVVAASIASNEENNALAK